MDAHTDEAGRECWTVTYSISLENPACPQSSTILQFALTNNQGGYIVLDIVNDGINVYAKNETYARNLTARNGWATFYEAANDGWYLGII
jgi:hypothetical protein